MNFKKWIGALLCMSILFALCGCSGNNENSADVNTDNINAEEEFAEGDWVEKYIKNLDTDEEREAYYVLWNELYYYCTGAEYALEDINNAEKYEFNPMDSENIPLELKDMYNFNYLSVILGADELGEYKMAIDATDVKLFINGEVFYPTKKTTMDIRSLVDKYNAE